MGRLTQKVDLAQENAVEARGRELSEALVEQFDQLHSIDVPEDLEIEKLLLLQHILEVERLEENKPKNRHKYTFNPSGSSRCMRELFYKCLGKESVSTMFPYHRRWVRNSRAVHSAVQKDLLYSEKVLENPAFTVARVGIDMLPAWEDAIKKVRHFGNFDIVGMMDGVLTYKDGTHIGFELKTKTNSIAQVGSYKLRDADPSHKLQCVCYSILFGLDEFLIMYEGVAKDNWNKNEDARPDLKVFYYAVTDDDRWELLTKFADVVDNVEDGELPDKELDKCLFCGYKSDCFKGGI